MHSNASKGTVLFGRESAQVYKLSHPPEGERFYDRIHSTMSRIVPRVRFSSVDLRPPTRLEISYLQRFEEHVGRCERCHGSNTNEPCDEGRIHEHSLRRHFIFRDGHVYSAVSNRSGEEAIEIPRALVHCLESLQLNHERSQRTKENEKQRRPGGLKRDAGKEENTPEMHRDRATSRDNPFRPAGAPRRENGREDRRNRSPITKNSQQEARGDRERKIVTEREQVKRRQETSTSMACPERPHDQRPTTRRGSITPPASEVLPSDPTPSSQCPPMNETSSTVASPKSTKDVGDSHYKASYKLSYRHYSPSSRQIPGPNEVPSPPRVHPSVLRYPPPNRRTSRKWSEETVSRRTYWSRAVHS